MTSKKPTTQITARVLQRVTLLAAFYVILIFLLPASQSAMREYNVSALEYRIIVFAFALPSLIAWFAAFIGYAKLREYVHYIRKTPEGKHFDKLAVGCAWLAWSLPVSTIAARLLNSMAQKWPDFYPTAIIVSNYLSLLLPLVAFSIIAAASRGLFSDAKLRLSLASTRVIMLLFLTLGVLYCYLAFQQFDLGRLSSANNPYFLPVWLMVLSVIVPYLYAWFMGLLAAYEISLYSQQVKGVLYRQALRLMVIGLVVVIISFVALQYTGSVQPRTGSLVLSGNLILTSVFRIVGGAGFVLMALGAIRLKKIEEV